MHATVKFTGVIEEILSRAVSTGIAKTKTEALRLGVLELGDKYRLLDEDELAVRKMQRLSRDIASGKRKVFTEAEVRAKYGLKNVRD